MSAAGSRVGVCRALFLPKALVAKGSAHFKGLNFAIGDVFQ